MTVICQGDKVVTGVARKAKKHFLQEKTIIK